MRIEKITLKNFRGFKETTLELNHQCNVIIGINGTGKTALLEGMKISIGSLMLGMDKVKERLYSPGIDKKQDVHVSSADREWATPQFPVEVEATGIVLNNSITWSRKLSGLNNSTTTKDANSIREQSELIQQEVRNEKANLIFPLVSFYNTDRFKKDRPDDKGIEPYGSRLRGYFGAVNEQTNLNLFLRLFRTETLGSLQEKKDSEVLPLIEKAIKTSIPEFKRVYHHVKMDQLAVEYNDGRVLPFNLLSEGVRITMALIMEISFRCYLLNFKKAGSHCLAETNGVVLIDEIDLHLHPSWQKRVLTDLMRTFPAIQFVVTTHAPMVLGGVKNAKVFALKDGKVYSIPPVYGKDANSILTEMGTDDRIKEVKDKLEKYFIAIENGRGKRSETVSLRSELETLLGKNSPDLQRTDSMLSFFED
jgi:predicted ATP-binding protein involved in virulence